MQMYADENILRRSLPYGYVKESTPKNGNCMLEAIKSNYHDLLNIAGDYFATRLSASEMREFVVKKLRSCSELQEFYAGCDYRGVAMPYNQYIDGIAEEDAWLGHVEMQVIATELDICIVVVPTTQALPIVVMNGDHVNTRQIPIAYDGSHYMTIKGPNGCCEGLPMQFLIGAYGVNTDAVQMFC